MWKRVSVVVVLLGLAACDCQTPPAQVTDAGVDCVTAPPGTACGTHRVCGVDGGCIACEAGAACAVPGDDCHGGQVECGSGVVTCAAGPVRPAGTACDGGVCDASGACVPCVPGMACTVSACVTGVVECGATGASCVSPTPLPAGTRCNQDAGVCVGSTCVDCVDGAACAGNPNACVQGVATCGASGLTCVDGPPRDAGTACASLDGGPGVCPGTSGLSCVACAEGEACATNPNVCVRGATACASGGPVCADTAVAVDAGAGCGTDRVCDGLGGCVACAANAACTSNPDPCKAGGTSCATGAAVCLDTATSRDAGTSCGTNQVCSPGGACVACTEGAACTTNPSAPCRAGVTRCESGGPVCVDDALAPVGATCAGGTKLCVGGACAALMSCRQVQAALPDAGSGLFPIDPDGADAGAPVTIYCDLSTADGGWTLCARTHPTFTGAPMLTTAWGTVTDGSANFGIDCRGVMAADHPTGNGEYRVTGTRTAYATGTALQPASALGGGGFGLAVPAADPGDPLWSYLKGACSKALPGPVGSCTPSYAACTQTLVLQASAPQRPGFVVLYATGPGPGGCGTSYEQEDYGSDGVAVNYNSVGIGGSTTTSYTGVFGIHYRHGCCSYAYYSTDDSAAFPAVTNLPVYHWVR